VKITKKKFIFNAKSETTYMGTKQLRFKSGGEINYVVVSSEKSTCVVGSKLYKWLGKDNQKVKITVERI